MESKMVHLTIRDKVNHNKIREKTKVKDIIEKIKETKWRWAVPCVKGPGQQVD